jgi:hypothetical protein
MTKIWFALAAIGTELLVMGWLVGSRALDWIASGLTLGQ